MIFYLILICYFERTIGSIIRALLAIAIEAAGFVALYLCATRTDAVLCFFLVSIILGPLVGWPMILEALRTSPINWKDLLSPLGLGLSWLIDIGIGDTIADRYHLSEKLSDKVYDSQIIHVKVEKRYRIKSTRSELARFVFSYTINGVRTVDTTGTWLGRVGDSAYIKDHIGQWGDYYCLDSAMTAEAKKVINHTGFLSKGKLYSELEYAKSHFDIVLKYNGVNLVYCQDCNYYAVHINKKLQPKQFDIVVEELTERASLGIDSVGYGYLFDGYLYSPDDVEPQCPQIKEFVNRYFNAWKPAWYFRRNEYPFIN